MKISVNKQNPHVRITAPEIESYREFYTLQDKDFHYLFKMDDWTLVEEEPEGWNKADCVKEIPFSLIYEEFAEHWRLGNAVEPGDYYIPISRLRWGIKGNLEEIPSNVDLEKEIDKTVSECTSGYNFDWDKFARHFYELGLKQERRNSMSNIKFSKCPFTAKHCKYCGELYCSDREYETPTVTIRTYNTINMEQKELTAQEIVEKLIDEKKINGKDAVILLNAINKPAEIRIEPYTPPITTPWYQTLDTGEPKCYEPGGTCINPHMDCINCPKIYGGLSKTYTASREIPTTMKEE